MLSLIPPPANLPPEKLGGYGFIEYESGVRSIREVGDGTINDFSAVFASAGYVFLCQPVLLGQKLHFFGADGATNGASTGFIHRLNTDGSSDAQNISTPLGKGMNLSRGANLVRMAASPDGKWLYLVRGVPADRGTNRALAASTVVYRAPLAGGEPAKLFVGDPKGTPGSDDRHFQTASGLDCDTTGRLYVCDTGNNRIQIFSAEGQLLKTVPLDRPEFMRVHPKTGALYVMHQSRVEGKSLNRLTKLTSFEAPVEEWRVDHFDGQALAVDAWTAKTRLWVGTGGRLMIYEEDGKKLNKVVDFTEEAKKQEGGNYIGQLTSDECSVDKVVCDPTRLQVYYRNSYLYDLKTGSYRGNLTLNGVIDDFAFDKRGYMHCHFNPGYYEQGVGRLDPSRSGVDHHGRIVYAECPYDYGEEAKDPWWKGKIPVKDQPGAKFFQDGIGVNMMGDVAEQCNIYNVPKMQDESDAFALVGNLARQDWSGKNGALETQNRLFQELEKRGEGVYFIRHQPGIPLNGATIWTYDRNGELKQELAVNAGGLITGVQMDEEGCLYFVAKQNALRNGKPFLAGKGGTFGGPGTKRTNPLIGTLMKTNGKKTRFLLNHCSIPLDDIPKRPMDLEGGRDGRWVEGMDWLYAGASPMPYGCSCPSQRLHTDWYKRTFVPEAYRHSFGVLDTAGNLIMHLGQYGNYDSGFGANSKVPVGGDNIALYMPRYISGTDNYLVFCDWGERLVVLKIAYQAEETVPIKTK